MADYEITYLSAPEKIGRRNRGLSVSTVSQQDQIKRNDALKTLEENLSHVNRTWGTLLHENTNPLELAMLFLDDTSVGLGYKYSEFQELKAKIENDLQDAVNEHYQAFNSNIASYRDVANKIKYAQDLVGSIKGTNISAVNALKTKHEDLVTLNESHKQHTHTIETLDALQELVAAPGKFDSAIADKRYSAAQDILNKAFNLAEKYSLWYLEFTSTIKQQLEMQRKTLFDILVEEIEALIYVKNPSFSVQKLFGFPNVEDVQLNDLENHVFQQVNIDVAEQSKLINSSFSQFLKTLGISTSTDSLVMKDAVSADNIFRIIYQNMGVINKMNEMHAALEIFVSRTNSELRNIVSRSMENIRVLHPAVMKILSSTSFNDLAVGSGKNIVTAALKEFFWDIFSKFLFVLQAHVGIFEISKVLQPRGSSVLYDVRSIWVRVMEEITSLLDSYLVDNKSSNADLATEEQSSNPSSLEAQNATDRNQIFSLSKTTDQFLQTKGHLNDVSRLLKDMLPGFDGIESMNLEGIYLSEEVVNSNVTLINPSAFNIKYVLEPFLLFVEGSQNIMYPSFYENTASPLSFFENYMDNGFFKELKSVLDFKYSSILNVVNPYLLEQTLEESTVIFKIAKDFHDFFGELLVIFDTTDSFKPKIANVLVGYLDSFSQYCQDFFNKLLSRGITNNSVVSLWANNKELDQATQSLSTDPDSAGREIKLLMSHCRNFYQPQSSLSKSDFFPKGVQEHTIQFVSTMNWLIKWMKALKKEAFEDSAIPNNETQYETETLKRYWTLQNIVGSQESTFALKLCLSEKCGSLFEQTVAEYELMLHTALVYLRYNLRAKSVYYISKAMSSIDWCTEPTTTRISEDILLLNSEISNTANAVRDTISQEQCVLIFRGFSEFLSNILVLSSYGLQALNDFGYKSLMKNFEILQKSTKLLKQDNDDGIQDAIEYYGLYEVNENRLVESFNAGNYDGMLSPDLIKNMLRLIFSKSIKQQVEQSRKSGNSNTLNATSKRLEELKKKVKQ